MNTPVAFLIFNRPDTTQRVFDAIRQARPPQLFLIADGPRADHPGEAERCAAARAIVLDGVDWPCDVRLNFADENMGCGPRPASGITWVFEQTEEAIILEDDCVPHSTFFAFCEEMLAFYRNNLRVMSISGNCFHGRHTPESYYFGWRTFCWGWATWRRAWQHFDFDMTAWPALRDSNWVASIFGDKRMAAAWTARFDEAHGVGKSHIWDYQWLFASLQQGGLCAVPAVNLVSNIGFGDNATHMRGGGPLSALPVAEMAFPLRHPLRVERDPVLESASERAVAPGLPARVLSRLRRQFLGRLQRRVSVL